MTTSKEQQTHFNSVPVETGVISLPMMLFNEDHCCDFNEIKMTISQMNHILSLLDEDEVEDLELDIDYRAMIAELNLWTSNRSALAYAYDHNFLCHYLTAFRSAEHYLVSEGVAEKDVYLMAEKIADGEHKIDKGEDGQLKFVFQFQNFS